MSGLNLVLLAFLILLVIVTGRPQSHLSSILIRDGPGGSVSISERNGGTGRGFQVSLDRHLLAGLAQLQSFLTRDRSREERPAFSIQENNSSLSNPSGAETKSVEVEPNPVSPAKCENDDELIYEPDGKCYKAGEVTFGIDSPCPDDFHQFQERFDKPGFGDCSCVQFRGSTTRPVVHWEKSNRCFWLYDQGPCDVGHWLVFSNSEADEKSPTCTKRTCPENPVEEVAFPKFYFEHHGKCYRTETTSPEFCGGDEKKKIYFSNEKPEPVCLDRRPTPAVRGLAGDRGVLACRSGFKQLPNGDCKRKAAFAL